jgi:hypothetical protein
MSSNDSETNPTIHNVLPQWQQRRHPKYGWEEGAWAASSRLQAEGVMVELPGGMPCPWCGAHCIEIDQSYIAVCEKNPLHKVHWVPWGG